MARKNPFEKVLGDAPMPSVPQKTEFTSRGASRSISSTLDDLADKADKLLEGETIIELDPTLVDPSFLRDRHTHDAADFDVLKKAIAEDGQNSPILVRPHPDNEGRYMVVFGARRRLVAEQLGMPVRAVVKEMTDKEHVVAQGQENAARSNLSFIERSMMAADVMARAYDSDGSTVLSALSIDKATLSKMLSVASIDTDILAALASAKSTGRDRWYELKTLLDRPGNLKTAKSIMTSQSFEAIEGDDRFKAVYDALKRGKKTSKAVVQKPQRWMPKDKKLEVNSTSKGKSFTLAVKAKDHSGVEFGEFVSERLEELYEQYKAQTKK